MVNPVNICLDYIRYQVAEHWKPTQIQFLSPEDITTTVLMVKTAITPRLLIADVKALDCEVYLQDWFSWVRNGIVDTIHPMMYAYRAGQIPSWVAQWDADIPPEKIIPILSLYDFNVKPAVIKTIAELSTEIDECKALNLGELGFAFFDNYALNAKNRRLIRNLTFTDRKLRKKTSH